MHHLTFLFAAGLISTISAAPLPAANDALLDFQARSGYADDDTLARIARSLDALDQELEERGLFDKNPKPFNPDKTPNKLKKAEPVPKQPNKQPKTSNTLKKEKKGSKPNPATNFRRGFGKEPKPFNPDKTPNKLKKAEPVPKVPNKQPKTTNTLTKDKKHKTNPATNFRQRDEDFLEERDYEFLDERDEDFLEERDEDFLEERDDEFLEERDEDLLEERDDEFLEERDEDFLEERDDEFLDERDEDFIVERGFGKEPKPFNPDKTANKLKKSEPVPKVPNKQPKTSNTLTKEKKGKKNPATNF
uniref:Uncharacterized protein n=1 Tax=Bionectria ochroleuca TaxID=29856 RepID=A0A0B7K4H0_BIOOC